MHVHLQRACRVHVITSRSDGEWSVARKLLSKRVGMGVGEW